MTALTALTLSGEDRRLLAMFVDRPAIGWDLSTGDWSFGSPLFSIAEPLLHRLDRLLLDGWLEPMEDPGKRLWQVHLTGKGREALR